MNRMGFISRLLGRQQEAGGALTSSRAVHPASKRQQPSSPPSGSFSPECFVGRPSPAAAVRITSTRTASEPADADSDDEDNAICVPGAAVERNSSVGRRRQAIDISAAAVQRLAAKVADLESNHLRASLDGNAGGVTHAEVEELYTDMQLIHRGRSSMVYRAREVRTGHRVVLKAYDTARMTPNKRSNLERHIRALKAAVHLLGPHGGAVALLRVVENPAGIYLVMQACNGGTLIEAIANAGGKLPERQVAIKVALPLLQALSQMHSVGIVHRDIKPEHLMIDNGQLRMGDFGSASCMTPEAANLAVSGLGSSHLQQHQMPPLLLDGSMKAEGQQQAASPNVNVTVAACSGSASSICSGGGGGGVVSCDAMNFRTGSIEYMAPEMLDKPTAAEVFHLVIAKGIDEDDLPCYDAKVDIWSLGVILYEALTGVQPFLADNPADMAAVVRTKLSTRAEDSMQQLPQFIDRLQHITPEGKSFVEACLTWEAAKRPSAEQLLQHPWLAAMQEQAAAVAASRVASRRRSMASFREREGGAVSEAAAAAAAAATAAAAVGSRPTERMPSDLKPADSISGESRTVQGASATAYGVRTSQGSDMRRSDSSGPLVDSLLAGALCALPDDSLSFGGLARMDTSNLEQRPLARAQTAANLEVAVQGMLRSSTSSRLDGRYARSHVHAP